MFNYFSVSKFFLYAAVTCVLIVSTSTLFPFIVGKYVFFRTAVALALVAFLLGWGIKEMRLDLSPLKSPLFIAVSVFVLIFASAGFLGINPAYSFWSNFERGEGVFQLLNLYIFFALLVLLLRNETDWRRFLGYALAVTFAVVAYGILASWGVPGLVGQAISFTSGFRFYGSLGNPAYIAPYLMFAIFYALHFLVNSDSKIKKGLLAGLVVFFLFFFWLAQTRGALLGLAAGIFAFLAYFSFSMKGRRRIIGVSILTALILIGGSLVYFQNSQFVQKIPGSRLFKISLSEATAQNRLWTWGSALKAFKERPILGWGPENFSAGFDKYFDTRHFIPGANTETWFDRAHSVFLGYLTDAGLLGFLSYLAIFVSYYYLFFKSKKASFSHQAPVTSYKLVMERSLFFALPVAYLVQGILLFDVLPIYINLFASLALANWHFNKSAHNEHHSNKHHPHQINEKRKKGK